MKSTWGLVMLVVAGVGLYSCFDPPEYNLTPEIVFENLIFKETPDLSDADSLILFLQFKDGDGNLGLDANRDTGCVVYGSDTVCYNEKFYFTLIETGEPVNYKIKRTRPEFGLPDFVPPYTCINWEVVIENDIVKDTLFFELNEDHYNIFVDFLVKQNDGSFQELDLRTELCTTYDGRFPILAKNSDLSLLSPVEGTLKYAMVSSAFVLQFSIKTVKLRVQIQDRLLNKSNIIETPEFQFK